MPMNTTGSLKSALTNLFPCNHLGLNSPWQLQLYSSIDSICDIPSRNTNFMYELLHIRKDGDQDLSVKLDYI